MAKYENKITHRRRRRTRRSSNRSGMLFMTVTSNLHLFCISVCEREAAPRPFVLTCHNISYSQPGWRRGTSQDLGFLLVKSFFFTSVCVWFPAVSASNGEQFTSGRFLSSDTFWCPWSHWNKCVLDGSGCVSVCVREREFVQSDWWRLGAAAEIWSHCSFCPF